MNNILNKYHSKIDKISLYIFSYCIMVKALIHVLCFVKNEIVLTLVVLLLPFILITKNSINHINKILHVVFRLSR